MQPQIFRVATRVPAILVTLAVLLAVSGCGRFPYKVDVRQGNYIAAETIAQIVPGMAQEQVRALLGAPMLVDSFHANRWDYIYLFTPSTSKQIRRQVTVFFAEGKVARVVQGEMAADPNEVPPSAVPRLLDLDSPAFKR